MGYREEWFKNNKSNYGWYKCVRCGKNFHKGDIDIDHIVPKNKGGKDNLNNLQCMCKSCNRSKKDSTKDTFKDYARNTFKNIKKSVSKKLKKAK